MDVRQLRIIHRLSPAWLVSLQDLSAGIAVPGLLTRGSSSTKLARHAFQDLGVPECTFRTIKHQSYKHRPKKIGKKNRVYVWEIYILMHLSCSDNKRRFQLKNLLNIKYFLNDSVTSHLKNVHSNSAGHARTHCYMLIKKLGPKISNNQPSLSGLELMLQVSYKS